MYIYIYIKHICMYVCMYVYMCIYIYIYIPRCSSALPPLHNLRDRVSSRGWLALYLESMRIFLILSIVICIYIYIHTHASNIVLNIIGPRQPPGLPRRAPGPPCGKAELQLSPFLRCSDSMFWRNSGESMVILVKLRWNSGEILTNFWKSVLNIRKPTTKT